MTIGEKIKKYRKELGYTQQEVASKIGVTPQAVFKYEAGVVTNIPLDKLALLANLFAVSPCELAGWDTEAEPSMSLHLIEKIPFISVIKKYCLGYDKSFSDVVAFYEAPENNAELENLLFYGVPKLNDKIRIESIIGCKLEKAVQCIRPEPETALPLTLTRSDIDLLARVKQLNQEGRIRLSEYMDYLVSLDKYVQAEQKPALIAARGDGSTLEGITSIDGDLSDHEDDLIP